MRRGRSGNMAIELAMWLPVVFLLIGGIIQFGKITYIYYSLQKTMNTIASYLAVQNGVTPTATLTPVASPLYLHDGRGLAAYTHVDVLYQAYFVAHLVLETLRSGPDR